ncbi:MAG: PP2C family serine/threonine-protein phosphatase [Blastocatellia bacterium]
MWRFAGARTTGLSHLKTGLPCQDYFACLALPHNTLVAAVADGAGSATMAEQGAKIAVTTVIKHLKQSLEEGSSDFKGVIRSAAAAARRAVVEEANSQGKDPRSYASTLLAVALTPNGGGALQIGDGVIVVSDDAEGWSWMFWPQRGEYANTTHFLTDENALEQIEVEVFGGTITDVALMSDGLEPLALHYASQTVHDPFFTGLFQPLLKAEGNAEINQLSSALEQFLASDRVKLRTDDDVSLILATRRARGLSR